MNVTHQSLVALVYVMFFCIATESAHASGIALGLCALVDSVILGTIGRVIGTIGMLILGFMATVGRVTWTQAIIVCVGIAVIFGAAAIVGTIALGAGTDCDSLPSHSQGGGSTGSQGTNTSQGCVMLGRPGDNNYWCPTGSTPPR